MRKTIVAMALGVVAPEFTAALADNINGLA